MSITSICIALVLTLMLQPLLQQSIFMLFFAAIAISTSYGGTKPGLLATFLSALVVNYFLINPKFSLIVDSFNSVINLGIFIFITIFISWLNSELRIAKKKLEINIQYLAASESRFRRLKEANIIGVIIADMNSRILEANDAFLEMVGYTPEELLAGRVNWREMTPPEYLEISNNAAMELKTHGVCQPFEKQYIRKDGSRVSILIGLALLENNSEQVIGFVVDVSQRKQAEQEREQLLEREKAARAEAEAANRIKDEFLATLSHELRTPLNAMLGWTQLLKSRKFDETTTAKALETIDRNSHALAKLIEDVLDVSRIIRGNLRLNLSPVELAPVVEAAIDTVRPAADAKHICIKSEFDPGLGVVIGDANRFQQIIWNLLSNAVKFTPKGGRVEVKIERINSRVQIQVSDTGVGISAEFLPHVFERFCQADSSTTRLHGGLGLGLAVVRHLVELHGGTVTATSPGIEQGSTFIINLPMKVVVRECDTSTQNPVIVNANFVNHQLSILQDLRVLVVDDEADARNLLTTILGQYGAQVMAVTSATEAMTALSQFQPDILISDIGMPEEDGYTFIRKVRSLPSDQGGKIPAVALTAYARSEDRTQALLAGFQLHIPKPVNAGELAAVVANLAGRT
ncbi:ATP-binding protein [Anabaena sp. UHCC 0451]|uniref:hybrid sensor histidine kinase/response regulator n=1 Tax=Anabaena sp. UHCC 0451 TaxID=2055235 RepID=UPI002B1EF496|nr:ATP-binding protein [Anabaena sp. UHCC 0451]MEA5577678.1 ATP-binding protein [Anabaena sp. UHCC 0451]